MNITDREKNVVNPPVVLPDNIFLPPLHIKMGIMKKYLQLIYKTSRGVEYLSNKFLNVSEAKIKDPRSGN